MADSPDAINGIYLTVNEFARLHNVNKRTLHYYDSIGVFSPQWVGENGYRYYTYTQNSDFEIILALRELGMSIEEIKAYKKNRNTDDLCEILLEKSKKIDEKIKTLKSIKSILNEKRENLILAKSEQVEKIDVVKLKAQYLLLTDVSRIADEDEMDKKAYKDFAEYQSQGDMMMRAFNCGYGSMLEINDVMSGNYDDYKYLFVKIPEPQRKKKLFVKPAGMYLRGFCKGDWDKIPETYERMKRYAKRNNLELTGYSYEEGINEMCMAAAENMEEYVTEITALVR